MNGPQKFRPYFTAPELLRIIGALKNETSPALELIKYLETFAIKIERGLIKESLTLDPTIEQKLGLTTNSASDSVMSELKIETLVHNWELFPSERLKFSPADLKRIQDFRYTAGRMTQEEEIKYENGLTG